MPGKKKKTEDGATDDGGEAKEGGGLSRMIMVGIMSVSIAAAGYFIGGGGGETAPEAAAPTTEPLEEEEHEPEIYKIVDLEPVNVNLTDAHYLRVAISLGIAEEKHDDEEESDGHGGGHGKAAAPAEDPPFPTAPAADLLLTTFAEKSMAELSEPSGRTSARKELEHHLKEYYGEEVLVSVFITEFVMQ